MNKEIIEQIEKIDGPLIANNEIWQQFLLLQRYLISLKQINYYNDEY